MAAPPALLSYIDAHTSEFITRLGEAVAIPSISGDPAFRPHVHKMSDWLAGQLHAVGVTLKQVPLGTHVMDGQTLDLPPAILGKIGDDPKKKTVLIYGHFDVQPAALSDGWTSEPFILTEEKDGRLMGRGSSDDKGPSDNYWLNTRTPALTYGLRGLVYFKLTISGPARDLQSGVFNRTVHEPMTGLFALMVHLVALDGSILVPGVYDMVSAAGMEARALYDKLDYSIADVEGAAGAPIALSADKIISGAIGERRLASGEWQVV
ncbi:hypothetical protein DFH09DRAFT_1379327 [Mycena vulgaris]|nr:hypothetical protein DFH09DRAFT_1379327 [Mycena vulgaris]